MSNYTGTYQDWSRWSPVVETFGENVIHLAQHLSGTRREITSDCEANDMLLCFFNRNVLQRPGTSLEYHLTLVVEAFLLDLVCSKKSGVWIRDGCGRTVEDVWDRRSKILFPSEIAAINFLRELTGVL
jgi:hypothetical protein